METLVVKNQPLTVPQATNGVQKFRLISQIFSSLINIWIGVQFYLFVESAGSGATGAMVARPPGVDGWLPIGSLVSLRYWWDTSIINMIHPAGLVIFAVILLTAFLFKKGFCSWICPVGFISEVLGDISDRIWRRRLLPPRWLDWPLRSLKYILLGLFIYIIPIDMTSEGIEAFVYSDYNKVSDILMLRFFTDISILALSVIMGLFVLSLVVRGFWCRYLCPYGGLLGLLGLISPTRIKRSESACIDCSSCSKACPSFIAVDKVKEVRSDECTGCMACVDSCPVSNGLEIGTYRSRKPWFRTVWAIALVVTFWGTLFAFKMVGPWQNSITETEYRQLVPNIERGKYPHP